MPLPPLLLLLNPSWYYLSQLILYTGAEDVEPAHADTGREATTQTWRVHFHWLLTGAARGKPSQTGGSGCKFTILDGNWIQHLPTAKALSAQSRYAILYKGMWVPESVITQCFVGTDRPESGHMRQCYDWKYCDSNRNRTIYCLRRPCWLYFMFKLLGGFFVINTTRQWQVWMKEKSRETGCGINKFQTGSGSDP